MNRDYIIAKHRIRLEGEELLQAVDKIEGFRPFMTTTTGSPLVSVTSEKTETMQVPSFQEEEYSFAFEDIHSTLEEPLTATSLRQVQEKGILNTCGERKMAT